MRVDREKPKPGEESVWDYPRPPRVEPVPERIRIIFEDIEIVDSSRGWRVLETSHPPVYYIHPDDLKHDCVEPSHRRSFCEWKGQASFVSVRAYGSLHGRRRAGSTAARWLLRRMGHLKGGRSIQGCFRNRFLVNNPWHATLQRKTMAWRPCAAGAADPCAQRVQTSASVCVTTAGSLCSGRRPLPNPSIQWPERLALVSR